LKHLLSFGGISIAHPVGNLPLISQAATLS
jgi:hypothetical protein